MNRQQLVSEIFGKKSFLCVGLDTDIKKIPQHLLNEDDPIFAFNKAIVDATAPYCVAYKPNLAFYEAAGLKGMASFEHTVKYLKENYKSHFIIADAKRGDIGNTSAMYARTFFGEYDIDALTVAPYMGEDSVTPFLTYEDKWVILLALTSNKGSHDFQLTADANGERLFEKVLRASQQWGNDGNMMYVVAATQGEMFNDIRKVAQPLPASAWRGRTGRQPARGVQIWHDRRLRTARQLVEGNNIRLCRRGLRHCGRPKGQGAARANGSGAGQQVRGREMTRTNSEFSTHNGLLHGIAQQSIA